MICSDDTSYGVPPASASSSARNIGLANASPTIAICVTRSRCTVAQSSCGSKCRPTRVTTDAPKKSDWNVVNAPVPCMSGDAGSCTRFAPAVDLRLGDRTDLGHRVGPGEPGQRVPAVAEHAVQVLVAPHDAFGHSRGAAGVEEVEVVTAAFDALHRIVARDQLLVLLGEILAR